MHYHARVDQWRGSNGQIRREVPPPVPCFQQGVCWASASSSDVHLAVLRNAGLGQDMADRGLCAKVQSACSMGLPRCHFRSLK